MLGIAALLLPLLLEPVDGLALEASPKLTADTSSPTNSLKDCAILLTWSAGIIA
jgi:hypothetical protein